MPRCTMCRAGEGHSEGCPSHPIKPGNQREWDKGFADGHNSERQAQTGDSQSYLLGLKKGQRQADTELEAELADIQEEVKPYREPALSREILKEAHEENYPDDEPFDDLPENDPFA